MSTPISTEAYAQIRESLQPTLGYLFRLRERLGQVGVLPDDLLFKMVSKTYVAMHALCIDLHYRSCSGGVGRTSDDDQMKKRRPDR